MKKTIIGLLIVLLGALTFGAVKMYVIDPKTVSTTEDILELFYQSRDSLPPLPSPVNYQNVMDQLTEGRFDFIANPNWAYTHDGGTCYLSEDSKHAKEWNLPMTLLAYEDLASGKVVLVGIPIETEKIQTLAIVDAPEFAEFDEKASIESYFMAELWPRRIIWSATLKPEADAWNDLATVESLSSSAVAPMMMPMSLPASPTNLVLAINSTNTNSMVEIEIGYPLTFTNRVEVFATTNLLDGKWEVVSSPIDTTGSSTVIWSDAQTNLQFRAYRVGNADLDSDNDGLVDAREILLYGTNPSSADSDGDFMGDAWELQYSLNPNDDLDMILDPDHDMLPNVYEQYYGLNPNSSDSSAITKLRVDPANATQPNTFTTIRDAFSASTKYSIIEMAPGLYKGSDNVGLNFPEHPVMLMSDEWGTNRTVEINSSGFAAFFLSEEQDNRTIIRGLNVKLSQGHKSMQSGFYLGNGHYPFTGSAPYFDGVKIDLCDTEWAVGFYGLGSSDKTVRFNNCIIRGANGDHVASGIYLVDSPKVHVANCSFMDFNTSTNISHGILFGTSSINLGNAPSSIDVRIENCFWDASFTTNSNYAVAHAEGSANRYSTEVLSSIVPNTAYLLSVDSTAGVFEASGIAIRDGLILSNSPCINASSYAPLAWYDFHGQVRDANPDIGADEYSTISTNDMDGDGLSDYSEAFTHFTSIFDPDSDEDGVSDGDEISCGTSPTNIENYCVSIIGHVDNQTGISSPVRASYVLGSQAWNAANAVLVSSGQFSYTHQIINSPDPIIVQVLVDLDSDGQLDAEEPYYTKTISVTNHTSEISFLLKDADGDGVGDGDEVNCGTDPNNRAHYCVTLQGTVTNLTELTDTVYASAILMNQTTPPWPYEIESGEIEKIDLEQVVVSNGNFMIDHLIVDQRGSNEVWNLWLDVYQDITTNETLDYFEPMNQVLVEVTNHTMNFDLSLNLNESDFDQDKIPDWWEFKNGLSYTNKADRYADFDGDWIDNKWEYDLGLDPNSYNANNYAFADAMQAIDSRIDGKNPSISTNIYTTQNHSAGIYVRNTNCWAADVDLTSCSPWNSYTGRIRAGTLISPRHVLFVNHLFVLDPRWSFHVPVGETLRFVDSTNGVYTATVESAHHIENADLTVCVLEEEVPTNRFSFAKILPDNFTNYLGHIDVHVPGLCLDQKERAMIHELNNIGIPEANPPTNYIVGDCSFQLPIHGARTNYYDSSINDLGGPGMRENDSGNPGFIILDDELVLMTLWVYGRGGAGSSLTTFKNQINTIIGSNGYAITEFDLSAYDEISEHLR